jgi:CrcB protein
LGGAAGSLLRWRVGVWLNPSAFPWPLGTWVVNCVGGFCIGLALAWFQSHRDDNLRLLLVTGGLGGLTTFSSFSGESLDMLLRGEAGLALAHSLAHLLGGLLLAACGWWLGKALGA